MRILTPLTGSVFLPIGALAHPDHADGVSAAHLLTDPFHVATGIAILGALLLIRQASKVRRGRVALRRRTR